MKEKWQNRNNYIQLYIPNRTAIVLCAEENLAKYGLTVNGRPVVPVTKEGTIEKIEQIKEEVKEVAEQLKNTKLDA
jgi:hypothetical protein